MILFIKDYDLKETFCCEIAFSWLRLNYVPKRDELKVEFPSGKNKKKVIHFVDRIHQLFGGQKPEISFTSASCSVVIPPDENGHLIITQSYIAAVRDALYDVDINGGAYHNNNINGQVSPLALSEEERDILVENYKEVDLHECNGIISATAQLIEKLKRKEEQC